MKLKLLPYLLLFCLLPSVRSSEEQIKFKRYSVADCLSKYDRRGDRFANYKYVGSNKTYFSNVDISQSATDAKNWQVLTPAKWDTEKYVQSGNYLINADKSNINWYARSAPTNSSPYRSAIWTSCCSSNKIPAGNSLSGKAL